MRELRAVGQTVSRAPTALTASIGLSPHHVLTLTATLTASGHPVSTQPVSFSTGHTPVRTPGHEHPRGGHLHPDRPQTLLVEQDHDTIQASNPETPGTKPSSVTAALN